MEQIEINLNLKHIPESQKEILPYELERLGFEGFVETAGGLLAYISSSHYNRNNLVTFLKGFGLNEKSFTELLLPDKNWNEEWEKNFEPVMIDNKCLIRAPFHPPVSDGIQEIIIMPKMSFGTGHHATTSLMVGELFNSDFTNKTVLDAGCGTGILAILAEKLGASRITAIDIDEWSFKNAIENISINNCTKIKVLHGDAAAIANAQYDVILANINLNVLVAGLEIYTAILKPQGLLIMSGILISDIQALKSKAEHYGLVFEYNKTLKNWALVRFKKN